MTPAGLQFLLSEYQSVRETSQHFWTVALTLATLGVTSLGGALGLIAITCEQGAFKGCFPPAAWMVVPLVPYAICAMFVQQAALQNARATYERGLEAKLRQQSPVRIRVDDQPEVPIPSFAEISSRMFDIRFLSKLSHMVWVSTIPYLVVLAALIAILCTAWLQLPRSGSVGPWRWALIGLYGPLVGALAAGGLRALMPGFLRTLISATPGLQE